VHPSINFSFLSCAGLWRQMFLTQPPCKTVVVSLLKSTYPPLNLQLHREAGIKMGELYDFIEEETRYRPEFGRAVVEPKGFHTEEGYGNDLQYQPTRCKVRNGEVFRPTQLPERLSYPSSERSVDFLSGGGDDVPHGVTSYEDYQYDDDDDAYSDDDDEEPDEFDAEQADEADQYFRW
jgi:hypothetical protein